MRKVPSPSFGIAMPWVLMFSMDAPNNLGTARAAAGNARQRGWLIGGIRRGNSDNLLAEAGEIKIELGKHGQAGRRVTTMAASQWTARDQPWRARRGDGVFSCIRGWRLFHSQPVP